MSIDIQEFVESVTTNYDQYANNAVLRHIPDDRPGIRISKYSDKTIVQAIVVTSTGLWPSKFDNNNRCAIYVDSDNVLTITDDEVTALLIIFNDSYLYRDYVKHPKENG